MNFHRFFALFYWKLSLFSAFSFSFPNTDFGVARVAAQRRLGHLVHGVHQPHLKFFILRKNTNQNFFAIRVDTSVENFLFSASFFTVCSARITSKMAARILLRRSCSTALRAFMRVNTSSTTPSTTVIIDWCAKRQKNIKYGEGGFGLGFWAPKARNFPTDCDGFLILEGNIFEISYFLHFSPCFLCLIL